MADKVVVVYSTPTWPYCHKVKEFLSQNNIKFQDYDVATDRDKAKEMVEKTQQMGVPVIVIDDKDIVIGFDQSKLSELLEIKN